MFTGLVEEVATVVRAKRNADGLILRIESSRLRPFSEGESIAVNGTCLTVKSFADTWFEADASNETLDKTNLGEAGEGSEVHLERAVALGERLGGHLVSGHIDGVGALRSRSPDGDYVRAGFGVPDRLLPFLAPKGSVTVDGVSLTINGVERDGFDVMLVPYTLNETTFGRLPLGTKVNLEVDILAKYVASLLGKPGVDGKTVERA